MASIWTNTDVIGTIVLVIIAFLIGVAIQIEIISTDMLPYIILIVLAFPLSRIISVIAFKKKIALDWGGRSFAEIWNEIKEEVDEAPEDFGFNYNFRIPKEYMPTNFQKIENLKIVVAEINRNEMKTDDPIYEDYDHTHTTILFSLKNGKMHSRWIGWDFPTTIKYIRDNYHLFVEPTTKIAIPKRIRDIVYGEEKMPLPTQTGEEIK